MIIIHPTSDARVREHRSLNGRVQTGFLPYSMTRPVNGETRAGLVKGFNDLLSAVLGEGPSVHGGRRVVVLTSDDETAAVEIVELAEISGPRTSKLAGFWRANFLSKRTETSWSLLIVQNWVKTTLTQSIYSSPVSRGASDRFVYRFVKSLQDWAKADLREVTNESESDPPIHVADSSPPL